MRCKKWGSVKLTLNRAQRDEVEKMEVYESICEQAQKDEMDEIRRSVIVSVNRAQKNEVVKMEICASICEQGTEE